MAGLIKWFGSERILKYFPPVVTGPIVISIGLCLSGSAISSVTSDWLISLVAIVVVIVSNMWGRGIVRIVPILLGVIASYGLAACLGRVDFTALGEADWIGLPVARQNTILAVFDDADIDRIPLDKRCEHRIRHGVPYHFEDGGVGTALRIRGVLDDLIGQSVVLWKDSMEDGTPALGTHRRHSNPAGVRRGLAGEDFVAPGSVSVLEEGTGAISADDDDVLVGTF
jgi:hypothetical protein